MAIQTAILSISGNLILAIIKGSVGYFGNSFALIADALESSADVFSSFVVLLGLIYASKPADENHPYGHGKAEPLITFLLVGFLITSASFILIQGIANLWKPQETPEVYTIYVLIGIILIKEGFYRYVKRKSEESKSTSLEADAWHHRSDAITSLAALVGVSVAVLFGEGFEKADDIAAIIASFFIFYNAFLIFRPALGEVMDEHLYPDLEAEIRSIASDFPEIKVIEKCWFRKFGMYFLLDIQMKIPGELTIRSNDKLVQDFKAKIRSQFPEIQDVYIRIESYNPDFEEKDLNESP
jgi:cation diffusion facilitator family transporter